MFRNQRKIANFFLALAAIGLFLPFQAQATKMAPLVEQQHPVDLVIALDVSGSMSGLIDSAKQRLWDIVNELAQANPRPDLRMAILTYGNPSYGDANGYVRIDMPFTRDLDAINRSLFSFGTDGGDEYVARVVHRAVTDLEWTDSPDALKMLFIAGNEEADQDPQISIDIAAQLAANSGIVVNTIYCGNEGDSIIAGWKAYSAMTNGLFANIDQNAAAVANIATPMDEELAKLNEELNATYIAYGKDGAEHKASQTEQDQNAAGMSMPSVASRTVAKAGALYKNSQWDLVDALESGVSLDELEVSDLPAEMRSLNEDQRKEYVGKLAARREDVSSEIEELGKKRQAFIASEREKLASDADAGLDEVIVTGVRQLAEKKGFEFKDK